MSLNITYQVTESANKDSTTTLLTCENEQGDVVYVEINPTELFKAMLFVQKYSDSTIDKIEELVMGK